jgi:uncharacterized membrane protein YeaQ/YmgE (transglycosylase-associated protein family)
MNLLWFSLIGLLAGWLGERWMKDKGFGTGGNVVVAVVGAVLGGLLFHLAGFNATTGLVGSLVAAVLGAIVLLKLITRAARA